MKIHILILTILALTSGCSDISKTFTLSGRAPIEGSCQLIVKDAKTFKEVITHTVQGDFAVEVTAKSQIDTMNVEILCDGKVHQNKQVWANKGVVDLG